MVWLAKSVELIVGNAGSDATLVLTPLAGDRFGPWWPETVEHHPRKNLRDHVQR